MMIEDQALLKHQSHIMEYVIKLFWGFVKFRNFFKIKLQHQNITIS